MSLSFKKLKNPLIGLTDKITFGKFKDCRVCDIIPDSFEYLMWAEKEGFMRFQTEVIEAIKDQALHKGWEQHQKEEIDPYIKDAQNQWFTACDEDDIPF